MNVTVFSLKNEKGVYAASINKKYIELFKLQRNMSLFNIRNIKMNKYEYKAFMFNNKSNMLVLDYLYDTKTKTNIEMVTTVHESDELSESCNNIHSIAETLEKSIYQYSLKPKYLNIITTLTSFITELDVNGNILNIDTFKLFYHLFRNTFSEDADKIDDKNI